MKKLLALLICTLAVFALASCEREPAYYLEPFDLTEEEFEVIKDITKRDDITLVTETDVKSVKNLLIAGKTASSVAKMKSYGTVGYTLRGKEHSYSEGCFGESLSALRVFTELKELELYFQPTLTDLSFLSELKSLEMISVTMSSVSDFTFLKELPELDEIIIVSTPVSEIDFKPENKISICRINGSEITDLAPFAALGDTLRTLQIFSSEPLHNTSSLENLPRLESFMIGSPEYETAFIKKLPSELVYASFSEKTVDLSALTHMQYLNTLTLKDTDGADLRPLEALTTLKKIFLVDAKNTNFGTFKTISEGGIVDESTADESSLSTVHETKMFNIVRELYADMFS